MSFILRKINPEGKVTNQIIGDSYYFIYDDRPVLANGDFDESKETPLYQEYKKLIKSGDDTEYWRNQVHFFLIYGNQSQIPIYKNCSYYIMTEGGKTFDTIKRCNF